MTYEELMITSEHDLIIKEKPLVAHKGRIKGRRIAIKQNLVTVEKKCTLAEELGHYYTSTGNILNQELVANRKQELRARIWGYNKLIGLHGIINAYNAGCRSQTDIANFLDVTDEYLIEAINCYHSKYGQYITVDNYIVGFEPVLYVLKDIRL